MEVAVNPACLRFGQRWKIMHVLKNNICLVQPFSSYGEQMSCCPPPFLSLYVFHFYFPIYSGVILAPYAHSLCSLFHFRHLQLMSKAYLFTQTQLHLWLRDEQVLPGDSSDLSQTLMKKRLAETSSQVPWIGTDMFPLSTCTVFPAQITL